MSMVKIRQSDTRCKQHGYEQILLYDLQHYFAVISSVEANKELRDINTDE